MHWSKIHTFYIVKMASTRRGAFIVLEGLDRSGKSTQCLKLVDNLNKAGLKAKGMRFPGVLVMLLTPQRRWKMLIGFVGRAGEKA
jgi:hypothetical protein